jgi:hypothetical protein
LDEHLRCHHDHGGHCGCRSPVALSRYDAMLPLGVGPEGTLGAARQPFHNPLGLHASPSPVAP